MEEKKLTGYPSIDKPWLKYYKEGAEERANNIPKDKTIWDVIEEKLIEYKDVPAVEYFGRAISRPEFIDMVYTWAKTFRAMGVKENEIVAYYGPFLPDVGAMAFALNMLGACPYFLKLAISPEALAEETKECKIAIVFEDMWCNVSGEFTKARFEKVIIINAADGMESPKRQVVSLLSKIKSKPNRIPKGEKYYSITKAKDLAKTYTGKLKVPFKQNRPAFITSSSGTTVSGIVKGVVATNETVIAQLFMARATEAFNFHETIRVLNNLPPTAATSLNVLCFQTLLFGSTIIIDPRISEKDFYNQIIKLRPNLVLTTGSYWETFFNRVKEEMNLGKRFDFSCAKFWIIGGEGTDAKKIKKWNVLLEASNAPNLMCSGYGSSEMFAVMTIETTYARYDFSKQIVSVGIPYVGINLGVFDDEGKEVGYNQRGELRACGRSVMEGYYNKPKLTAETKVDGWIHTGDLAEIDENGFVYIWGRMTDKVNFANEKSVYLFDIANEIKRKGYINDAIVLSIATEKNEHTFVAHIVWRDDPTEEEKKSRIEELNAAIKEYSQGDYEIAGYYEHKTMLPYSPTTLKRDKNKMSKQRNGYIQIVNGNLQTVNFE